MSDKKSYWDLKSGITQEDFVDIFGNEELVNIYENLTYNFLVKQQDEGIYFEDASGIAGWLFYKDAQCRNFENNITNDFQKVKDATKDFKPDSYEVKDFTKQLLRRHEKITFNKLVESRKNETKKMILPQIDIETFEKVWKNIPNRILASLTLAELSWLVSLVNSECKKVEKEINSWNFLDDSTELAHAEMNEVYKNMSNKNIFRTLPDWLIERLSSEETQDLINFISKELEETIGETLKNIKTNIRKLI